MNQYLQQLLHHPEFQKLEALWRSTEKLINEEASDEQSFFLLDISKDKLISEIESDHGDFEQKLMEHIHLGDGEQVILFVADYYFSEHEKDRQLLKFCTDISERCAGLFLAGADSSLIESMIFSADAEDQQWADYLQNITPGRLMLSYPGFLMRLPYGKKREEIEAFEFEECNDIVQGDDLLWGNSAFLLAGVLVRISQGQASDADFYFNDIPVFAIEIEGEQVLQPGTETSLNESQVNRLLAKGILPIISYHQRQGVRVAALSTLSTLSAGL